jgi:hypothetical protein
MSLRKRWIAATALAAAAVLTLSAPASAAPASSTHLTGAIAISAKSNKTDWQFRFETAQTNAAIVNARNSAYSTTAGCSDCGAAAVSFQVVQATHPNISNVNAANDARAYAYKCVVCSNLAVAYQFVIVDPGGKPLTADEKAHLAQLKWELQNLRNSGQSPADLSDEIDGIAQRVVDALQAPSSNQRSAQTRQVSVNRQVQAVN